MIRTITRHSTVWVKIIIPTSASSMNFYSTSKIHKITIRRQRIKLNSNSLIFQSKPRRIRICIDKLICSSYRSCSTCIKGILSLWSTNSIICIRKSCKLSYSYRFIGATLTHWEIRNKSLILFFTFQSCKFSWINNLISIFIQVYYIFFINHSGCICNVRSRY